MRTEPVDPSKMFHSYTSSSPNMLRGDHCVVSIELGASMSIIGRTLEACCMAGGKTQTADLRTGKGLGLVLGFMLSVKVKIKVRVSSSIYPIAGLQSAFNPWPYCIS